MRYFFIFFLLSLPASAQRFMGVLPSYIGQINPSGQGFQVRGFYEFYLLPRISMTLDVAYAGISIPSGSVNSLIVRGNVKSVSQFQQGFTLGSSVLWHPFYSRHIRPYLGAWAGVDYSFFETKSTVDVGGQDEDFVENQSSLSVPFGIKAGTTLYQFTPRSLLFTEGSYGLFRGASQLKLGVGFKISL